MGAKKLGLVIVDGVGYRNFVLSNFCIKASGAFEKLTIYSGLPAEVFSEYISDTCEVIELPVFKEGKLTWFYRKLKEVAHLQKHKKQFFGIAMNLEKNRATTYSKRSWLTRFAFIWTSLFNSEKNIIYFYKKQKKSFSRNTVTIEYYQLLKETKPDVLFFTHQRPPYLAPLDAMAKKLSIKTCSFIFSWDNLPSKGRMAAPFDSYVVWSDLMKEELHYFYPETKSAKVSVVGTPQFEPYVLEEYFVEKANFESRFSINSSLKTICYSCGDVSTSKNDVLYVEVITKAIEQGEIEPLNFIVRTSPAEDGSRFSTLKEQYPNIIWNFPQWTLTRGNHPEPWSQRVPENEDLRALRSLLMYCDLNVNMCSTMGLDFMLFDKPVVNSVFGTETNGLYNDGKYLKYGHYERVVASGSVAISRDEVALVNEINFSLKNPLARLEEQKALLKLQIGKPLEGTSQRIIDALKSRV